jgi:hypothetical protein
MEDGLRQFQAKDREIEEQIRKRVAARGLKCNISWMK